MLTSARNKFKKRHLLVTLRIDMLVYVVKDIRTAGKFLITTTDVATNIVRRLIMSIQVVKGV